jgi:hypothetical protein
MDRTRLLGAVCACTFLGCSSSTGTENGAPLSAAAKSEGAISRGDASDDSALADGDEPSCLQEIDTQRVTPTVWFVVDGSGSMLESLSPTDSSSRWEALRTSLLDEQTGVLKGLVSQARVGMLLFDGPLPGAESTTPSGPATTCPRLVSVDPELDNFTTLEGAYTPDPLGGSTPTDKALDALIERADGPAIVILATDGQPNDFCSSGTPAFDVRGRVVDDAKKLAEAGNELYVISLAGDDMALTQHLDEVAAASGTGKPAFTPQTTEELAATIRDLTSSQWFCEIELSGPITRRHSRRVSVALNGQALERNDPNGWHLRGSTTIEITGEACNSAIHDPHATIHVEYPCEAQQP